MPKKPPFSVVGSTVASSADAPPEPLGEAGSRLWTSIVTSYDVSDAGGQEVLLQASKMADLAAELAAAIERDGAVLTTRTGPKSNPATRDLIQARAFIVRSLQRLGINFEPIKPPGRPAGIF